MGVILMCCGACIRGCFGDLRAMGPLMNNVNPRRGQDMSSVGTWKRAEVC